MPKPKTKTYKNRKHGIKHAIKTKKMAGYVPKKARVQVASLQVGLASLQLRREINKSIEELITKFNQFKDYKETLLANYQYNYKTTPTISINLIEQINEVLERIEYLIRLYNEDRFLEQEVTTHGYNSILTLIETTLNNIDKLEVDMQLYKENLANEYRKAELGIVNTTNRRADATTRRRDSEGTRSITRRSRSI